MTEDEIQKIMNAELTPEEESMNSYSDTFPDPFPVDVMDEFGELNKGNDDPDLEGAIQPQSTLASGDGTPLQPQEEEVAPVDDMSDFVATIPRNDIGAQSAHEEISFKRAVEMSFKVDNPMYGLYDMASREIKDTSISLSERNQMLTEFDPTPYIEPRFVEEYGEAYVGLVNETEVLNMNKLISVKKNRRAQLAKAGLGKSVAAGFVSALPDPLILLPGGAVVGSARKGVSIGKSLMAGAAATAAIEAGSETILHQADPTRTATESVLAVGIGATLGGGITGGMAVAQARKAARVASRQSDVPAQAVDVDDYVPVNWDAIATLQRAGDDDIVETIPVFPNASDQLPTPAVVSRSMDDAGNEIFPTGQPTRAADAMDENDFTVGMNEEVLPDRNPQNMMDESEFEIGGQASSSQSRNANSISDDGLVVAGRDVLYGGDELQTGNAFVANSGAVFDEVDGVPLVEFLDADEVASSAADIVPGGAKTPEAQQASQHNPVDPMVDGNRLAGALGMVGEETNTRLSKLKARIPELRADAWTNSHAREIFLRLTGSATYRIQNAWGVSNTLSAIERLPYWFNKANKTHREVKASNYKDWLEANPTLKGREKTTYNLFLLEVGKAQELLANRMPVDNPHIKAAAQRYNRELRAIDIPYEIPRQTSWINDQTFLMRTWNTIKITSDTESFVRSIARAIDEQNMGHAPFTVNGNPVSSRQIAEDMVRKLREGNIVEHNVIPAKYDRNGTFLHDTRTLRLPLTDDLEKFLVLDPKFRTDFFLRAVGRRAEEKHFLQNELGVTSWSQAMDELKGSYDAMRAATTNKKTIAHLHKEEVDSAKLLQQLKEELYGGRSHVGRDPITTTGYNFRKLVTMASLGNLFITSIPDLGNIIREAGFGPAMIATRNHFRMKDGRPTIGAMNRTDLEDFGVVTEYLNNKRVNHYIGGDDKFEELQMLGNMSRGIETFHKGFFIANGASFWNQNVKELAVGSVQHKFINILMTAKKRTNGKLDVTKLDDQVIKDFARFGLGKDELEGVHKMLSDNATQKDGMWLSNFQNWDANPAQREVQRQYIAMLTRVADNIINTPNARTIPRWMTNEAGALIGQFSSFVYAAHMQTLMPALQNPNFNRIAGMTISTGLGYLSWQAKQRLAGRDPSDENAQKHFIQSADASGALALFFYADGLVDRLPGNISTKQLIGADGPDSSYIQKQQGMGLLGPWAAKASGVVDVGVKAADGQGKKAAKAAMYIVPYANLPYVRMPVNYMLGGNDSEYKTIDEYRGPYTKKKKPKYTPLD